MHFADGHGPYEMPISEFVRATDSDNLELSNTLGSQDTKMKFKKKSQIDKTSLNNILENKARISINGQTGHHEFIFSNKIG